jgi:hypothetical protein
LAALSLSLAAIVSNLPFDNLINIRSITNIVSTTTNLLKTDRSLKLVKDNNNAIKNVSVEISYISLFLVFTAINPISDNIKATPTAMSESI